jgi:hypothetical protein
MERVMAGEGMDEKGWRRLAHINQQLQPAGFPGLLYPSKCWLRFPFQIFSNLFELVITSIADIHVNAGIRGFLTQRGVCNGITVGLDF